MKLLIIAGMPSAGKSTIAKEIGQRLGFPVLEKDDIKEELFDTLGYANLVEKKQLDIAATAILIRCTESMLASGSSLIVVNNFRKDMETVVGKMIERCGSKCVTLFLGGDCDVFYERYVERDRRRSRHLGHTFIDRYPPHPEDNLNVSMTREYFDRTFIESGMADFRTSGSRIEVDATYPEKIDVETLVKQIRAAMED